MPVLADNLAFLVDGAGVSIEAGAATGLPDPTVDAIVRFRGDQGYTADGEAAAAWSAAVGGLTAADFGGPSVASVCPTGKIIPGVNTDGGMRVSGIGALPSGNAARTAAGCFRPIGDAGFGYSGPIGWGGSAAVNDTAFTVGMDGDGYACVDFRNVRFASPVYIRDKWAKVAATHDGATVWLYVRTDDESWSGSTAKTLNTGSDYVNIMLTFSGISTPALVADAAAWASVKSASEIAALFDYWDVTWTNDVMPPQLTGLGLDNATATSLRAVLTTDEPMVFDAIVTDNLSQPSLAQVAAGQDQSGDPAQYALLDQSAGTGQTSFIANGLLSSTAHALFVLAEDAKGNRQLYSFTNGGVGVATLAENTTPPTLSAPAVTNSGTGQWLASVSTDQGDGQIYFYATTSAAAQDNATVLTAIPQAVTQSGVQAASGSWPAGTTGYVWALHVNASGYSAASPTLLGSFATEASGSSDLTPDQTATSPSDLRTKLLAWQTNWVGTVPAGKTAADKRVMGCTFGTSSDIDLSGIDFSVASGKREVTIRMVGSFTASGTGVNMTVSGPYLWTGLVNLTSSKNIRMMLCHVKGEQRIRVSGSEDVTIEQTYIQGNYGDLSLSDGSGMPTTAYGFAPDLVGSPSGLTTRRLTLRNNLIRGFWNAGIQMFGLVDGALIEGNVFDALSHDDFKFNRFLKKNVTLRGNYGCRFKTAKAGGVSPVPSGGFHEDFHQLENTEVENLVVEENLIYKGVWGGLAGGVYQGFYGNGSYGSGVIANGISYRRNVTATDGDVCFYDSATLSGAREVKHNAFLMLSDGNVNPTSGAIPQVIKGGVANDFDYNITTSPAGSAKGEGPNGLNIDVGDKLAPNTGALLAVLNAVPARTAMIEALFPKTGAKLHWSFGSGRCQAADTLRKIFVDGAHPENVGWPVAPVWRARWNANASPLVPTTYTGSFDGDGSNR